MKEKRRKTKLRRRGMLKHYNLQAHESTCLECTLKYEVVNSKEDIVVEKEKVIMKKDMKNKEIIRKKKNEKKYSIVWKCP